MIQERALVNASLSRSPFYLILLMLTFYVGKRRYTIIYDHKFNPTGYYIRRISHLVR